MNPNRDQSPPMDPTLQLDPPIQHTLGKEAEAVARDFLIAKGPRIICENFKCRRGELDLIAIHNGVLIVVEVRMRSEKHFGGAAESITQSKRKSIIKATKYFLMQRPELRRFPVRFDVITIDGRCTSNTRGIMWLKDAFQALPRD